VKAAIFDCDGVLVDSEWASAAAWRAALARFDYPIDEGTFGGFIGTTDRALSLAFAAQVGVEAGEVLDAAEQEMRRIAGPGLKAFPDAMALVDRLAVPIGVASNSDRWRLEVVLSAAGVRHRFDVTVAGDEVPQPKPAHDIYLRAADLLEVNPSDCLVIEDSPTGVAAARAAGMEVVAVRRGHFGDDVLAEADRIVDSLDEL
jgi:HAD superfamily hydrolase (TIGR01509 family)